MTFASDAAMAQERTVFNLFICINRVEGWHSFLAICIPSSWMIRWIGGIESAFSSDQQVLAGPWMLCWIAQFKHFVKSQLEKVKKINPTIRIPTILPACLYNDVMSCRLKWPKILGLKAGQTLPSRLASISAAARFCVWDPRLLGRSLRPLAMQNIHVSNEKKKPSWLGYIGYYTTQLYDMGIMIIHCKDP